MESFLVLRKATAMMEMAAMMAGKKNTLQGDIQQAQHAPLQEFDNRTERIHLLVLLQRCLRLKLLGSTGEL